MKKDPFDPKRLLRCPNRCGSPIDFSFGLRPCVDCGTPLCENCRRRWRGASYCKRCLRTRLDERSRGRVEDSYPQLEAEAR